MTNSEVQMAEAEKLLRGERAVAGPKKESGAVSNGARLSSVAATPELSRTSLIQKNDPPLPGPLSPRIAPVAEGLARGEEREKPSVRSTEFSPLWRLIGPSLGPAPGVRPSSVAATNGFMNATALLQSNRTSDIAAPGDGRTPLKAADRGGAGARPSSVAATNGFTDATQLLRSNRKSDIAATGDGRAPPQAAPLWHPPMRTASARAAPPPDEHVDPSGYQGVYILMEKIKRGKHRVDVAKVGGGGRGQRTEVGGKQKAESRNPEDDLSGGYIFKKDRVNRGEQGFGTERGIWFAFEEPKERDITPAQRNWLTNYLNEFERVLFSDGYADPTNGYAKYIDADSFIDFHWFVEVTRNIDGYRFSQFYHKDRGGKLKMGPVWDLDMTFGNAGYFNGYKTNGWAWAELGVLNYKWLDRLFEDHDFLQKYIDRWAVLRTNVFATSNLLARLDQWTVELGQAPVRNYERWPTIGTYVSPNRFNGQTFEDELGYLKNWITGRLAWIDSQGFPAPAFQTAAQESSAANKKLTITCAMGKILYTLDGSDPRLPGGAPSPKAVEYVNPVYVPPGTLLTARVRSEYELWSAPAVFRGFWNANPR